MDEVKAEIEAFVKSHYPNLLLGLGYKMICEQWLLTDGEDLESACYRASKQIDELIEEMMTNYKIDLGKKTVTFDMEDVE